jgi:VanZ family protein
VVPLAIRRGLCAAHLALIAALSLLPPWWFPPPATQVPGMDKVVHVGMYGVLGALLRWAAEGSPTWAKGWTLPLAGAAYGLLMEGCQLWFSGGRRSFSWADALANLAGVMIFWHLAGRVFSANRRGG